MGFEDRGPQPGAADDGGEAQLVPTGHEDPGCSVKRVDGARVVGFIPRLRPEAGDPNDTEPAEDVPVEVGGRVAEGGRGADHDDVGLPATRQLDKPGEDDPLAELVLGPADDHDGTNRTTIGRWSKAYRAGGVGHLTSVYRRPNWAEQRIFADCYMLDVTSSDERLGRGRALVGIGARRSGLSVDHPL